MWMIKTKCKEQTKNICWITCVRCLASAMIWRSNTVTSPTTPFITSRHSQTNILHSQTNEILDSDLFVYLCCSNNSYRGVRTSSWRRWEVSADVIWFSVLTPELDLSTTLRYKTCRWSYNIFKTSDLILLYHLIDNCDITGCKTLFFFPKNIFVFCIWI